MLNKMLLFYVNMTIQSQTRTITGYIYHCIGGWLRTKYTDTENENIDNLNITIIIPKHVNF